MPSITTGYTPLSLLLFVTLPVCLYFFLDRYLSIIDTVKEPTFDFLDFLHWLYVFYCTNFYSYLHYFFHSTYFELNLLYFSSLLRWTCLKNTEFKLFFLANINTEHCKFPCVHCFSCMPRILVCGGIIIILFKLFSNSACDHFFDSWITYKHTVKNIPWLLVFIYDGKVMMPVTLSWCKLNVKPKIF